jgi:hypothetical protein
MQQGWALRPGGAAIGPSTQADERAHARPTRTGFVGMASELRTLIAGSAAHMFSRLQDEVKTRRSGQGDFSKLLPPKAGHCSGAVCVPPRARTDRRLRPAQEILSVITLVRAMMSSRSADNGSVLCSAVMAGTD